MTKEKEVRRPIGLFVLAAFVLAGFMFISGYNFNNVVEKKAYNQTNILERALAQGKVYDAAQNQVIRGLRRQLWGRGIYVSPLVALE